MRRSRERRHDRFRVRPGPRLGTRLGRALVATSGAALLVAGLIFDGFVYYAQRQAMVDDLTVQARIVAENSSASILFDDRFAAAQTLGGLQASPAVLQAELRNAEGQVIARLHSDEATRTTTAAALDRALNSSAAFVGNQLRVREAVREGRRSVGTVDIVADLRPLYRRVGMHVAITVLAAGVAFGCAFLLVVRIRRDIDATESRLDFLAYYDPVTGLPNRHAANEQMARLISAVGRGGEGFALLLLDLDDFKLVNDTLGHSVGDELLRAIAQRLLQALPPTDMACRLGGDEFVVMAPRVVDAAQLQALGELALKALRRPVWAGGHELQARGSLGIACFPADAGDAASLLRAADTAMYEAKARGKNTCAVFTTEMERGARLRMRLDAELRHAIARGELHLLYQPIVDIPTQRLTGVEALLRWTHPELGPISPAEFIPLAEASSLIVDLGHWVLNAACRQLKAWADAGHDELFVAINVSARQIRRGLREQIEAALQATGARASALEIEITEHSMVEDIDDNVAQLTALGELGVRVAVDDFGTGLSSLAYLKRLPINKLKIDRTFVMDLPHSRDGAAITQAIISMAHSLALTVVAEGIETQAQHDLLAAQGCDCAQGFLFSRPVEPAALGAMLQRQREGGSPWQPRPTQPQGHA